MSAPLGRNVPTEASTMHLRESVRRLVRGLDRLADSRLAVAAFGLALVAFCIESIAWPAALGRDGATYLMYYRDMWNAHPAFPELMLFRTPLAPLVLGPPLQFGGPIALEVVLGLMYATSIASYALAARKLSPVCSVLVTAVLLLYPGYGALFHEAASDSVFAFTLALWTLAAVHASMRPTPRNYALLGAGVLALVLARPSSQIFVLFALVPLVAAGTWRIRLKRSIAFIAAAGIALTAYAGYNAIRYDDFVVARTLNADVPFYRTFVLERTISPQNGPASRHLVTAVRQDLLPKYGGNWTVRRFFGTASDRMWGDLVVLSDQRWGWNSDYATLRRVALEAIRAHPGVYARDVASAMQVELSWPYLRPAPVRIPRSSSRTPAPATPKRSSGKPVDTSDPGGILWWLASTPDGHIRPGPHGLVWTNPGGQAHAAWLNAALTRLISDLPDRSGSHSTAVVLNDASRFFPRPWMWLLLGALALVARRPRRVLLPTALAALGLVVVFTTVIGMPAGLEYRVPFDPLFVLFAVAAITHPGRARGHSAVEAGTT